MVRSTTQRNTPSPLPCAVLRLANTASIPLSCNCCRCGSESYARSPCTRCGRRRGLPGLPLMAGIASISGSSCVTSCALAAVKITASGIPPPSVITWCLLPAFALSVGLGPVFCPLLKPAPKSYQQPRVTSRVGRHYATSPAATRASVAIHRLLASRAAVASTSCHYRSPSLGVSPPSRCQFSGQREYPSGLCGYQPACDRGSGSVGLWVPAARVQSVAKEHHRAGA